MLSRKTLIALFILLSSFVCFIPFRFSQTAYAATTVNLSYSDVAQTSVNLNWSKSKDLVFECYRIYMRTKGVTDWNLVWTFYDKNNLTYKVTGLSPETTYEFKVTDYDLLGGSADSNIITLTTTQSIYSNIWFWVGILMIILILIYFVTRNKRNLLNQREMTTLAPQTP